MDLKSTIRTLPDYPKPGIMFRDVTTLFGNAAAFSEAIRQLAEPFKGKGISKVAGIEARGFILGGAMADYLGAGFVPLRKPGKLPFETLSEQYELEYGTDELHIHTDAVSPGEQVLLVDDLIATGGTALAGLSLLRRAGAMVMGTAFIIDLPELGGAAKLAAENVGVHTLIAFDGH
ncbi:MAG: adenine phosphoribosyltransferase [Pseudomonadota bacterium]